MITLVDDFLTDDEMDVIWDHINKGRWSIQSSNMMTPNHFLRMDLKQHKFFSRDIFRRVCDELGRQYDLLDVYYNGQWVGRDGDLHTDNCDMTALLYVSSYGDGWGGFTQINTKGVLPKIIPPVQKRLVAFPGNIIHKGFAYSQKDAPMRISLTYKLKNK